MTDKFQLFRLPYVALNEVLNHFRPEATLPLSLCSKKSKRLVKHCQEPRKKINIDLNVTENVLKVNRDSIMSVNAASSILTDLETVNIGSNLVPVKMEGGILKTYWMDVKEGLKEVIKYTSDVFNRDLFSIEFRGAVPSDDSRYWLEWIKAMQGKLPRISLWSGMVDDNAILYILDNETVAGDIVVFCPLSPGIRGLSPRPFSIDSLDLQPSYWFTLNHLLAMDIKRFYLNRSPLTCQEINTFLKKWIDGEWSKRIKELNVFMEDKVNYDVLMEGIEVNRRDPSLSRDYASYYGVEHMFGGFDVRRKEDGAMATIIEDHEELKILFWPDYEGNPYY